jgi:hypothetical protein
LVQEWYRDTQTPSLCDRTTSGRARHRVSVVGSLLPTPMLCLCVPAETDLMFAKHFYTSHIHSAVDLLFCSFTDFTEVFYGW